MQRNTMAVEMESELQTQMILLAASKHDLEALRALLRGGSANVQDPDTGFTPLHTAIAACEPVVDEIINSHSTAETNIHSSSNGGVRHALANAKEREAAATTLKLLFQNGAIWNDLDNNDETPGCMAYRLGLKELYEIVVDAGVRAELLLNRLDEFQLLEDSNDEDEDAGEVHDIDGAVNGTDAEAAARPDIVVAEAATENGLEQSASTPDGDSSPDVNSSDYLVSTLRFTPKSLLDADNNGVMMSWETNIMRRSAESLMTTPNLRVLNVGHGMGIIDGFFQAASPSSHHIIEAHPAVLQQMQKDGWFDRPGVVVHEGRWQDVLPKLIEKGDVMFDAIYFDTFAEDYKALRTFFSEFVVELLDPAGCFGFFDGLGADRQVCYDVYTKVSLLYVSPDDAS